MRKTFLRALSVMLTLAVCLAPASSSASEIEMLRAEI